ncbi:hypothetical protein [Nannocystis pusilla]|uniref:hypothetical protein n=1 Tax=Nannocystis pusilla TaxID=889268 RepID=UPI003DA5D19D
MAEAPRRIAKYLRSDDERPFIHKAFDQTLGDGDRLAYAELVVGRDPARAEWLRLEVALHARATDDPAVLARFVELSRKIGLDYADALLREEIMNCGSDGAKQAAPRVRFAFACPMRWKTLAPEGSESVRLCQQCNERVYYCETVADAEVRAFAGQWPATPSRAATPASSRATTAGGDRQRQQQRHLRPRQADPGSTPGRLRPPEDREHGLQARRRTGVIDAATIG